MTDKADPSGPVPVTVIGGFLGAGKTTLLNHLIAHAKGRRFGVVVNDFGSINIDAELILDVEDDVVRLTNGCVCCSMRGDLRNAVLRLLELDERPDQILIETSGVSEPDAIIDLFGELDRSGVLRFDGLIALVDVDQPALGSSDRAVAALARAQVRSADLVVLNKVDLVERSAIESIEAQIKDLAPQARCVEAVNAALPLELVIGSDLRGATAGEHPHDHASAHDHASHTPGFSTLSFTTSERLSFKTLGPLLRSLPAGVLRAKGFLQISEREGQKVIVHVVGRRLHVRSLDDWGGEPPVSRLVFIGPQAHFNVDALKQALRAVLTSPDDAEFSD
ncbi:putative metal chaperone, involved in Zn homeostasis, GTPase of COG0523 family protein [Enhygromyxa salina]|uniref:Putative metal chaperone, involved in Zn homeostasis, GTPase of COG0523 family protein n=1 Tax=Enhygromyxa salina TaxID=215803 RepID=A0A0C2A5Y7_9BACT|nr:GTP-binding protein [Enhygromyxa salina]KIG18793.1 putative metal chaperone, involved in Zn homeostasis, GTPase of COG0523 family protein [Enhygromyxa salina]